MATNTGAAPPPPPAAAPGLPAAGEPGLLDKVGAIEPLPPISERLHIYLRIAIRDVTASISDWILYPDTVPKTVWSVTVMGAAVLQALLVPYAVAFSVPESSGVYIVITLMWIILLCDIVVGFRTAYINEDGQVVDEKRALVMYYLRHRFALDVIANVPIEMFTPAAWDPNVRRTLMLNRVVSLYKAIVWIRHEEMKLTGSLLVQVFKFLLILILVIHYYACIWWLIGLPPDSASDYAYASAAGSTTTTDTHVEKTWSQYDESRHTSIDLHTPEMHLNKSLQYIYSAYWVINLVTVPGFADLEAPTFKEKLIGLVMFLSGLILFGYVTASVTSILANRDSQRSRYQQKLLSVRQYMDHNHFDSTTRKRVSNYYDYLWKRNKGIDAKTIFTDLPTTFQAELALGINGHIISKVPLFQDTEIGFMRMLSLALQPVLFLPLEYVVKKGDIGSEMFFIHKGRVDVVSEDGTQIFASMHEGSFFGEIALFFSRPRTASIRAASYTDIYVLSKQNLEEVLAFYPAVKERILLAAEERLKENEKRQQLNVPKDTKSPQLSVTSVQASQATALLPPPALSAKSLAAPLNESAASSSSHHPSGGDSASIGSASNKPPLSAASDTSFSIVPLLQAQSPAPSSPAASPHPLLGGPPASVGTPLTSMPESTSDSGDISRPPNAAAPASSTPASPAPVDRADSPLGDADAQSEEDLLPHAGTQPLAGGGTDAHDFSHASMDTSSTDSLPFPHIVQRGTGTINSIQRVPLGYSTSTGTGSISQRGSSNVLGYRNGSATTSANQMNTGAAGTAPREAQSIRASILDMGGIISEDGEVVLPDSLFGMRVTGLSTTMLATGPTDHIDLVSTTSGNSTMSPAGTGGRVRESLSNLRNRFTGSSTNMNMNHVPSATVNVLPPTFRRNSVKQSNSGLWLSANSGSNAATGGSQTLTALGGGQSGNTMTRSNPFQPITEAISSDRMGSSHAGSSLLHASSSGIHPGGSGSGSNGMLEVRSGANVRRSQTSVAKSASPLGSSSTLDPAAVPLPSGSSGSSMRRLSLFLTGGGGGGGSSQPVSRSTLSVANGAAQGGGSMSRHNSDGGVHPSDV
ncbi:hypothetical protein H9P43_005949 [Blastocladiella emersonii ATCC 22665]|nr:hypothetical protein H9P43_005949 [Blastocladiella emersonii ATCC 22665]